MTTTEPMAAAADDDFPFDDSWFEYKGNRKAPEGHEYRLRDEAGTYIANRKLITAVNTALLVEKPLLVTGESGSGKTMLAWSVASELGLLPVLEFHTRSDHRARDLLFIVDNMRRFYDAQAGHKVAEEFSDRYISWQPLGVAITSEKRHVVLIDEIDKAPRDFPNDLLDEIDAMKFTVPELKKVFASEVRPIVIITSNNERQLPDPFLRRCVFHRIEPPSTKVLGLILKERYGAELPEVLMTAAVAQYERLREDELRLEKKPATGELIVWVRTLIQARVDPERLGKSKLAKLPFLETMIKNASDQKRLEKAG
ncbi:MAG TPA: MoxR family ATPase [Thermoanaerobaculia bacterium]|nr:MoxR family ATPase [Thermoanaerobaculia bacterium]